MSQTSLYRNIFALFSEPCSRLHQGAWHRGHVAVTWLQAVPSSVLCTRVSKIRCEQKPREPGTWAEACFFLRN